MGMKIKDTDSPNYKALRDALGGRGIYNGAYYYSKEIVKNIIPNVKTNRPWDTLGLRGTGSFDDAIVFLHHNVDFEQTYGRWLGKRYKNQVFIVNQWATYDCVKSRGLPVFFLPLSIDTKYVKQYKTKKTKEACYAGNRWFFRRPDLEKYIPEGVDFPPDNIPREELLKFMAPYKTCYAIARCALEAQALGCEIKKCDSRFNPEDFPLIDNKEAAKMLQKILDDYDGV